MTTMDHSCSVLGTKKKARDSCLVLDERNTREHICLVLGSRVVELLNCCKHKKTSSKYINKKAIFEILRNLLFIALACVHNVCLFGIRLHITG